MVLCANVDKVRLLIISGIINLTVKYKSLPELFFKRAEKYGDRVLMRYKTRIDQPLQEYSWNQTKVRIEEIALGLRALGSSAGDHIGLLATTCHLWLPIDFGILTAGAVTVPLYHNSATESVKYIVNDANLKFIFVKDKIQLQKVRANWSDYPHLRFAIVMFDRGDIPKNDPRIITLDELQRIGRDASVKSSTMPEQMVSEIRLDDLASIIYTSGTTGEPKGVMLTHRNFLVAALSFYQYVPLEEGMNMLSFLPLAHIFERVSSEFYGIDQGVVFTYCEKIEYLPSLLIESKCNIMTVVPRMLEKIYDKVIAQSSKLSPGAQRTFNKAVNVGRQYMKKKTAKENIPWGLELKYSIAHKVVLSKIKEKLAPDLKIFVVGGAPFSTDLSYFFLSIGYQVVEGYGLTETSAPITVNPPWANRPGTVGLPFRHFEVKISDEGEILCRGESVFAGYYNKPEATAEAIVDGWFHTGDVGEFDADGYLRITGRKKDLIVTTGGKKIAPTKVEATLLESDYLSQAVVFGEQKKYLAALLVINESEVAKYLRDNNIEIELPIHKMQPVYDLIEREVTRVSVNLNRFEQIKAFAILEHEFTIDSGELTPTLKVKRNVVYQRYQDIIEPLFNRLKPEHSADQ